MSTKFKTEAPNPQFPQVMDIHPSEVLSMAAGQALLIDVRQIEEYTGELGHIAGTSLVVLDTLPEKLQEYSPNQTLIFICRSGNRSARAAAFAQEHGYDQVFNMFGGLLLWNELGYPREF